MFLPNWRFLDIITWAWSTSELYSLGFFLNGFLFISLPLLIFKFKKLFLITLSFILIYSGLLLSRPILSEKDSKFTHSSHCGSLTYTGIFFHFNKWLTPSHSDDLEIRNQFCWIRKLIQETPQKFDTLSELDNYLKVSQDKLLAPNIKFRSSLPLIAFYQFYIFSKFNDFSKNTTEANGKIFIEGLTFWENQYTFEIHKKDYPLWDFPHGPYVKWEYGILEKNWEEIINFINSNKTE